MDVIENPPIPYIGLIPGGVQVGRLILITGDIPYGSSRFCIDLSQHCSGDIPLHTSIRFDERIVVRNSYVDGKWQNEERDPHTLPFSTGSEFEILYLVEGHCIKIAMNGRHYAEFAHRLPVSSIDKIVIEGTVRVKKIEFSWQPSYAPPTYPSYSNAPAPSICPPGPFVPPPEASSLQPVYNPSLPFQYPIYGGLECGMMIYISGRPTVSATRFDIDLQTAASSYPPPDIALHFSPRFDRYSVVRNNRINNSWGPEEMHAPTFPFVLGVHFDMIIRVDSDKFMVAVNGKHYIEFRHRVLPLCRVNTLVIEGDAIISCIRFQ